MEGDLIDCQRSILLYLSRNRTVSYEIVREEERMSLKLVGKVETEILSRRHGNPNI